MRKKVLLTIIQFYMLLLMFWSLCGTAQAAADAETVIIQKDGQMVDKFCGVKAYYVKENSNTGNYCCAAYVKKFYAALYDVEVSQINTHDGAPVVSAEGKKASLKQVTVPQPGDIMQNKARSHVAIVKKVKGNEVTLIEQNWKWTSLGVVYAKKNRKITADSAYFYRLVLDGKEVEQAKSASAPTGYQVWQVAKSGGISLRKSCSSSSSVRTVIPYNKILKVTKKKTVDGRKWGKTEYNGKNGWILLEEACYVWGEFPQKDTEPPVISDIQIVKVTRNYYTITCKVQDNAGIARVQFPSWSDYAGQDDLAADWAENPAYSGTINGDTVTFRVKRSAHNGEYGIYHTHIYAFDTAGNHIGEVSDGAELGVASLKEKKFYAYLQNRKSNQYITTEKTFPEIHKFSGKKKQLFCFTRCEDGYYKIQSADTKKFLYVQAAADGKGSMVRFGKEKNIPEQLWRIYGASGKYVLRNKTMNEVVMLKGDSVKSGIRLRMNGQKACKTYLFQIEKKA